MFYKVNMGWYGAGAATGPPRFYRPDVGGAVAQCGPGSGPPLVLGNHDRPLPNTLDPGGVTGLPVIKEEGHKGPHHQTQYYG